MTNQEVNRLYWELPEHQRTALDLCLADGRPGCAASVIQDAVGLHIGTYSITDEEAVEWAKWRMSLRYMAGR